MPHDLTAPLAAGKLPGDMLSRLLQSYGTSNDPSVVVNPAYGFDAAAVTLGAELLLVKSDPITFSTADAAGYLVSVNANDIACLGGIPRWMTVVALLPERRTTGEDVEQLFVDLHAACAEEGVSLIGGHTEITIGIDRPLLIGTLLGTPGAHGLLQPGNANATDDLYVTGSVGLEGTAILAAERPDELARTISREDLDRARAFVRDPGISISRVARSIYATGRVTAMHDPTEGGLATAVHEIGGASALGAVVERESIPVHPITEAICHAFAIDPLGLLSSGALLFTAPRGNEDYFAVLAQEIDVPITRIGRLTSVESEFVLMVGDTPRPLPRFDSDEITRVLT